MSTETPAESFKVEIIHLPDGRRIVHGVERTIFGADGEITIRHNLAECNFVSTSKTPDGKNLITEVLSYVPLKHTLYSQIIGDSITGDTPRATLAGEITDPKKIVERILVLKGVLYDALEKLLGNSWMHVPDSIGFNTFANAVISALKE